MLYNCNIRDWRILETLTTAVIPSLRILRREFHAKQCNASLEPPRTPPPPPSELQYLKAQIIVITLSNRLFPPSHPPSPHHTHKRTGHASSSLLTIQRNEHHSHTLEKYAGNKPNSCTTITSLAALTKLITSHRNAAHAQPSLGYANITMAVIRIKWLSKRRAAIMLSTLHFPPFFNSHSLQSDS
jgi:hypothetical protein